MYKDLSFLEVKNILKTYPKNEKPALKGLAFSMKAGEIISFVGPSGSGKSTLLKLIGGLISQDEGEVLFKGKALAKPEDQLIAGEAGIKMVFQDLRLMPNHSVEENVKYPLLTYTADYQKERTEELLSICGLLNFRKRLPRELSGGQQQRLAFAKTLAEDPELLLMDEPFSNLDPLVKEDLIIEVTEIVKNQGLSLIMVTHDTQDALMISDRVGMIKHGILVQMDTPEHLYFKPKDLKIGEFFGTVNAFSLEEFEQVFGKPYPEKLNDGSTLAIRAEAFSLNPIENGYRLQGELLQRRFLGPTTMLELNVQGKRIELKLSNAPDDLQTQEFYVDANSIMQVKC